LSETITKDPDLYRTLSDPFESQGKANAACEAFYADLRALREKHRLRDVYVILEFTVRDEKGQADSIITMHCGDVLRSKFLTAYAFGSEQRLDRLRVDEVIKQGAGGA
jgi:hypothetical protein